MYGKIKKTIAGYFLIIALALPLMEPLKGWCSSLQRETGLKYIRNYSRKEYKSQPQNWSIIQDRRGIIYVANNGGLLEFDGVSWREMPVLNKYVRSLAMDDNGTIYVGGKDEIGYLAPDPKGMLQYVSLCKHIGENDRNFSHVYRTHSTGEGIYFRTLKYLFLWDSRQMKVWPAPMAQPFVASFLCRGKLYIRQNGVGLLEMNKGSLQLIPEGETFAAKKIYMMVEYEPGKLLIGTRSNGFYRCDCATGNITAFETEALGYINENDLSCGLHFSSGDFVLGTLRGGIVIIDPEGNVKNLFNKTSGLRDNCIWDVFEDSQGNLWLALNKGAAKIEYTSPISIYNEQANLSGIVLSITRHGPHNDLYAGTTDGLYVRTSIPDGKFHPVPGIAGDCCSLLSFGDSLLAATISGVFQVKSKKLKEKVIDIPSYVFQRSKRNANRIWVGTREGLVSLYLKNGQWEKECQFENINQEIRTMLEDKKGSLWLGTLTEGVLKVDFPADGTIINPVVKQYDTLHQLSLKEVHVFMAAGHVMFATKKGIFRFDKKTGHFFPDTTLGRAFAGGEKGRWVFRIAEDGKKNTWIHSRARNIQAIPRPNGTFALYKKPFFRLPLALVNAIYPDGDIIWFAGVDGLVRYDTKMKKDYNLPFQTLIRKVWVNGEPVFAGHGTIYKPVIQYKDRSLRFEFAAPFFEAESRTQYQCLLEGYDEDWTEWNKETWKDYTNVDPGLNTFRVRAKNVYGNLGGEAAFQFKVLPHWTNTWWAFTLYVLAAFLTVFFIVKWRSKHLEKEKQELEQIIKERTKEIEQKNQQLEEMNKVKSRFFANISHEFRTPLTLILGPLEQMISDSHEKKQENQLKMMLRNSQRLLGLINQLLELSKFESGNVKLEASCQDLVSFLKGITASFEVVADQRELNLTFRAETEDVMIYIDPMKMEEVICNLLSNAVKFTPVGGKVTVSVTKKATEEEDFPSGYAEISVCDTGPGIPREQMANIFDRFYQSDSTYEHHRKGSGIGLAIAKELVALHHGTISVHSREGEESGTEFVIRLPMGKAHLKPEEMVNLIGAPAKPRGAGDLLEKIPMGQETGEQISDVSPPIGLPCQGDIILVVEDSADVRTYIRGALEPLYTVVEAKDGKEGIKKALEIIPDLIISDIMMPGKDGYELCRTLKNDRNTSHVPIILLTAKASEENILEGLETGADDYITKPFNTRILCARIKNLIDIRAQLQQNSQREMTLQPVKMAVSKIDEEFIKDLQDVIEKNVSEPEFNVEEMCKKLYMSGATLYRKIQALSGESPTEYIRSYRLKRAAQLLKRGFGSVTEVAFEVGFASRAYFTKCFKEKFHQLPSTFHATESPETVIGPSH